MHLILDHLFLSLYSSPVNYGRAYREALEIQEVLKRHIDATGTTPRDAAACARSWDVLEDRKREIRGKPKTGAYKPQPKAASPPKTVMDTFDPSSRDFQPT